MNLLKPCKNQIWLLRMYCILIILLFTGSDLLWATNYEVGEQKPYTSIGGVPWGDLHPGDSVLIFYRDEPYKEKWVICTKGLPDNPVVISGVPDMQGRLPVIDGQDAVTDSQFNYWNENRGIIKIGGANSPSDTMPEYIVLQNLDIENAQQGFTYTGREGVINYNKNAAAVYIEYGEHLIIRNCIFHDCGNGFFSSSRAKDVIVEGCYYYDNGVENSIYEHNNYTESKGIIFQYNRFGPLRENCGGNNLKDRSLGCVIRYNWIEGGNRQLDLVHSEYKDYYTDTLYNKTFVYGNVLIEPDGAGNSQVCHYGGDNPDSTHCYRKGTLYFYHNTVISTRSGNTTLVRLSTNDEKADIRNNIVYVTEPGSRLAIVDSDGTANLRHNWLKTGWRKSHSNNNADVNDSGGNVIGEGPGFRDLSSQDFALLDTSHCISGGTLLAQQCLPDHMVLREYVKHQKNKERRQDAVPDLGAFEYSVTSIKSISGPLNSALYKTWNSPNPFDKQTRIYLNIPGIQGEVEVRISTISGMLVRKIHAGKYSSFRPHIDWDGRDDNNRLLPNGSYYYHIYIGSNNNVVRGRLVKLH